MRFLIFLILGFTLSFQPPEAFAEEGKVITGSVVYTVESAKKLAFEGLDKKLSRDLIKPYWYDEKNKENLTAAKEGKELSDRFIMTFTSRFFKGYTIVYNDKPQFAYYYTQTGYLGGVDYDPSFDHESFPYKVGKYTAFGTLISVALYISDEEQYSYSKSGKLLAHWVGNIGYNEKGKEIARRQVVGEIPNLE